MQATLKNEFKKTGTYDHRVIAVTQGFVAQTLEVQCAVIQAFKDAQKGDWLYTIECAGEVFFVVENGEGGYTAMLAEEY